MTFMFKKEIGIRM